MELRSGPLSLLVALILLKSVLAFPSQKPAPISYFNRSSFPPNFIFGAASSSYQYEGAAHEDGKGINIWDTYTRQFPGKILDHSNGDVAVDFYHRYKGDVHLMKTIGLNAFRFSFSWSRLLPNGKLSGGVNKKGVEFYNNLINNLIAKGIQPFATIFHWDLPQALEDEYKGFLSEKIVNDLKDFADLCFKEFGDRVKYWSTINEPWTYAQGYDTGDFAPGRCSAWKAKGCPAGDSGVEPYLVTHNLLLSHAAAVKLYRLKYQAKQRGKIGIVLVSYWMEPFSNRKQDIEAARRALDFMYGWYIEPLTYGQYPKSMVKLVGERLPKFSKGQALLIKGSFDFLGVNYYTANYAANIAHPTNGANISYTTDSRVNLTTHRNGKPIGEPTGVSIFYVYPKGLKKLLLYTKENYENPTIYITECGLGDSNITTVEQGVNDQQRKHFYQAHLSTLKQAIQDGVNVKGFFAWSFLDNFEWGSGYTQKFGIVFVNFKSNLERHLKLSAYWLKKFLS